MQVSTYMHSQPSIPALPPTGETHPTRQRLLDAAFRVCTERGLHGATTREIADAARVNEVTLFRHFGSKEKLIAALFQRSVAAQTDSFNEVELDSDNLQRAILHYAQRLDQILFENEGLIRTMLGESRRYPEQARQVISDSIKPLKQRLTAYLTAAQKAGTIRKDLAIAPTLDCFSGMLLSGMLKRTGLPECLDYSQEIYVTTAVDLFIRGIAAPVKPTKKRRA